MDTLEHQTLNSGRIVKAPVNRGFSKILDLDYTKVAAAGTNTLVSIAVPVGYFWVIENVAMQNTLHAVISMILIQPSAVLTYGTPALMAWLFQNLQVTMSEGQFLTAWWYACTANDVLNFRVHGRQVKIT